MTLLKCSPPDTYLFERNLLKEEGRGGGGGGEEKIGKDLAKTNI